MKKARKLITFILTVVMVLSMSMNVWAANDSSITIQGTTAVPVTDKTFTAYRILDVQISDTGSIAYTVPTELKNFYATKFSLDENDIAFDKKVTDKIALMTSDSQELYEFAEAALAAAKTAGVTGKTGDVSGTDYVIQNLPLGYYVVEDSAATTPVSALVLDTTNTNITVEIKADEVTAEKQIIEGNDSYTYNNAAIGDIVNYEITSSVPSMQGYDKYYFIVHDTMDSGLTFNDDVAIKVGDDTLVKCDCSDDSHVGHENGKWFTVETTGTTEIKIVFNNFIQYATQEGKAIEITYTATVNTDAVIGIEGNKNTASIEYSNNPNISNTGVNEPEPPTDPADPNDPNKDDPTGDTTDSVTYTYVTGIELLKVDAEDNTLKDAIFKIEGSNLNTVLVKTTDPSSETEVTVSSGITGTVGNNGVLQFDGLSAGTYTITEIQAPEGYNLLTEPITLTITCEYPTTGDDCTWKYSWNGEEAGFSNSLEVINNIGSVLPSTGGIGTTIFYIVGGALVLFAVVLLVTKKRMKDTQ